MAQTERQPCAERSKTSFALQLHIHIKLYRLYVPDQFHKNSHRFAQSVWVYSIIFLILLGDWVKILMLQIAVWRGFECTLAKSSSKIVWKNSMYTL